MSQAKHTGKILILIATIFIVGLAAAGYYGFGRSLEQDDTSATSEETAKTDSAETSAAPTEKAADAAPTPAQLGMLMAAQPNDIVYGSDKAPVTIIEYASLSCPHCAHFYEKILPDLKKEFIDSGKARLVFRHFPHNEPGLRAAQLVNCADAKQRPNFIKVLYDAQDGWAFSNGFLKDLKPMVSVGGIDSAAFDSCIADKAGETAILEARKQAIDLGKINSVPSFIINGAVMTDNPTLEHFRSAIAAANAPAVATGADKDKK